MWNEDREVGAGNANGSDQTHDAGISIRDAQIEDSAQIGAILAEAFTALYDWTFGRLGTETTARLLTALYAGGSLSLDTTRVAVTESKIAGVIILHVGESIGRGSVSGYWRIVRQEVAWGRRLRAFFGGLFSNFIINKRIPTGEDMVYIEALAVAAQARGKGIGTRLLNDGEAWAVRQGRKRMALHVLLKNTRARRLYERMGFRPWQPGSNTPPPEPARPGWTALLMARTLPEAPQP